MSACDSSDHRLSINRPTKRRKEKSPSDGQCQCEKEMDDHQIFEMCHIVTRIAKERASF
jgi:hypothetical protein